MNFTPEQKKKLTKWIIGIAAACIIIFLGIENIGAVSKALSWCADVLMPLIIGCAIALIVNVPMGFLERNLWKKSKKKFLISLRRPIALVLSLIFIIGIFVGVIAVVLPTLIDTITVLIKSAVDMVERINSMSKDEIAELPLGQIILDVNWSELLESAKSWLKNQADAITNAVFGTIGTLLGSITDMFVSVVFAIYIIFGKEKLKKQAKHLVSVWLPKGKGEWLCHAASVTNSNFKNFIVGQFFECVIIGVLCFLGMLIFKFPYAAMVSVLVGVTALIPVIGGLIGGGVGAFMILTVDPIKAVWFVVFLLIMQQLENNIVYPRLMGSRVNLPGMWILAAVTIGGGIGGPIGMLLGVPIVSTALTLFDEATEKRKNQLKE